MTVLYESAFLAKAEATYATDPTTAAASDAVFGWEVDRQTASESVQPDYLDGFSGSKHSIPTIAYQSLSIKVPLSGAGLTTVSSIASSAAPVRWEPLAEACGLVQSHTSNPIHQVFKPTTAIDASAWIECYQRMSDGGGIKWTLSGCRGNTIIRFASNEAPSIAFALEGLYVTPTDVTTWSSAVSGLAFDQLAPPACRGMTLTVDSVDFGLSELEIDLQVETTRRESMTATHGVAEITAVRTGPTMCKFKIPAQDLGTYDWFTELRTESNEVAISLSLGSAAGNTFTLTSSTFVATGVSESVTGGAHYLDVEGVLNWSSGDDEFTLTITD